MPKTPSKDPGSAKSASRWGNDELDFFKIFIRDVEERPFFDGIDEVSNVLLKRLEIATPDLTSAGEPRKNPKTIKVEETMIDSFGAEILRATGYENQETTVLLQHRIPFTMLNDTVVAKANVSLYDITSKVLLNHLVLLYEEYLIQENKMIANTSRPFPQLMAGAIAAF